MDKDLSNLGWQRLENRRGSLSKEPRGSIQATGRISLNPRTMDEFLDGATHAELFFAEDASFWGSNRTTRTMRTASSAFIGRIANRRRP